MFVNRSSSSNPTLAEITELEQVLVVEIDAPSQVTESGQSTIVVGEAVNDQGVPNVPRRLQALGELDSFYGGFKDWIGSAADGFEGNFYAHLYPTRFPDLIVITPDMSGGEVQFTYSSTNASRIPAGTRVSDGGTSIWATLEDLDCAAASYLATTSMRVRWVSGAASQPGSGITTIVDALVVGLTATVTNADPLTAALIPDVYEDAIDAALDETSVAADGTIIFACLHSSAIEAKLQQHCVDASAAGRGRICVVSPAIGTSEVAAVADVAAHRTDRLVYAWPGVKWLLAKYDPSNYITTHFDAWVASVIAHVNPEESPGQVTPYMAALMGTEAGITPTRAFYKAMKAAGVCSLNIDRLGNRIIYSAVTSSLTSGKEPIEQRRFSDLVEDSLAQYLATYKDKLLTQSTQDGCKGACDDFLSGLVDKQRCTAFSTDVASVNTPSTIAMGIFYVLVKVKRTPSAKFIVLLAQVGTSVVVSEA